MTSGGSGAALDAAVRALESDARLDPATDSVLELAGRISRSPAGAFLRGEPLGHALHPLMTDLPIGCWTSAAVLDLVGGRDARPAARRLIGLGVLSAVPTALSGFAELGSVDPDDRPTARVATAHAGLNSLALLSYARSWSARRRDRQVRGVVWSVVGATAASISGHLGGHLAFVRGVGSGRRVDGSTEQTHAEAGAPISPEGGDVAGGDSATVVGLEAAAEVLGVEPVNVQAMIDEGLLEPVGGDGQAFRRVDLEAVRLLGG